jgi:exodeoxyribonuclease V gamma subunit
MPYFLHQSNDLQQFIPLLAQEVLRKATIFQPVILVTQNKILEYWLKETLSTQLGVCMAVEFHSQESVIPKFFSLVSPSLFDRKRMLSLKDLEFRLFHALGLLPQENIFLPLRTYLQESSDHKAASLRRQQFAKHLAHLFLSYEKTRPDLIACWKNNAHFFSQHSEQTSTEAWQQALWRKVYADTEAFSQAEVFELLSKKNLQPEKPLPWIGIFGSTFLLESVEKIFLTLASHTEVHRFWWNPSASFWGDALSRRLQSGVESVHPLLENWGKLGRNQLRFFMDQEGLFESEHFRDEFPESLLGQVQRSIFTLEETPLNSTIPKEDDSIKVFSCVGKRRELEVLHDQIAALLNRDSDLCLTDIVVAAPNIEDYTGLIEIIFGMSQSARIPHQIFAPKNSKDSPFLEGVFLLLDLAQSRFTPKSVFHLLRHPCFLRRHGLTLEEIEILRIWVRKLSIRIGWDAAHREELDFSKDARHTWEEAFTRIALGFAMPVESPPKEFEGVFPFPVSGLEEQSRLLGILRALGENLRNVARFSGSFQEWVSKILLCVSENLQPDSPKDREAFLFFEKTLTSLPEIEKMGNAATEKLDFPIFLVFLKDALESESFQKGASGKLLFAPLRAVRAVPFKVMILLGMNEGAFPSMDPKISEDLRPHSPKPLDATQRDVDLYAFLEALASTREKLWIFYSSKDLETHVPKKPALPVQELLHFCQNSFQVTGQILETHPFHSSPHPDPLPQAGEGGGEGGGTIIASFIKEEVSLTPSQSVKILSVESLERFLKSPAEAFFREALQWKMEEIPTDSEGEDHWDLERYTLLNFNHEILKNVDSSEQDSQWITDFVEKQKFSGSWPKGVYGEIALETLNDRAERVLHESRLLELGKRCAPVTLEEKLSLKEMGIILAGIVPAFFEKGFLSVVNATPDLKHHRNAWLYYLLLRHRDSDNRFPQMISAVVSAQGKVSKLSFTLSREEARAILCNLVEFFLLNLETVIPIYFECCEALFHEKTENLLEIFEEATQWCEYSALYFKTAPNFEEETLLHSLEDFTQVFYSTFFSSGKQENPYLR